MLSRTGSDDPDYNLRLVDKIITYLEVQTNPGFDSHSDESLHVFIDHNRQEHFATVQILSLVMERFIETIEYDFSYAFHLKC